jgi:hypothetical protein
MWAMRSLPDRGHRFRFEAGADKGIGASGTVEKLQRP